MCVLLGGPNLQRWSKPWEPVSSQEEANHFKYMDDGHLQEAKPEALARAVLVGSDTVLGGPEMAGVPNGCGSIPMLPVWGRCTTLFLWGLGCSLGVRFGF